MKNSISTVKKQIEKMKESPLKRTKIEILSKDVKLTKWGDEKVKISHITYFCTQNLWIEVNFVV